METLKHRMAEAKEHAESGFTLTEMTLGTTILLVVTAIYIRFTLADQVEVWQGLAVAAAVSTMILAATLTVNHLRNRKKSQEADQQ